MRFGGELKSVRGQSVGEDSAGLQLVEKLATPLALFLEQQRKRSYQKETLVRGNKYKPQWREGLPRSSGRGGDEPQGCIWIFCHANRLTSRDKLDREKQSDNAKACKKWLPQRTHKKNFWTKFCAPLCMFSFKVRPKMLRFSFCNIIFILILL